MPMEPDGGILQEEQLLPDPNGGEEVIEIETMPQESDDSAQEQPSSPDQKPSAPQGASKEGTSKP